uniref:Uncharacterized protein n=1 Tax=Elaeophora elaphi TaxID=1147741 RepID=A0A0R3S4K0_9BILA
MGSGKMMDGTLKDGFEWLLEQIYHNYEELQKRVNEALEKLKNRQAEERIRRQHHLAATVSSSTTSDEQINDAGTAAVPVAVGAAQHDEERKVENELINHSIIVPSQKAASTNQITNSKTENVGSKRKRYLRNTIHPKANLPPSSIDSARMKNPQIFVVKTLTPSTEVNALEAFRILPIDRKTCPYHPICAINSSTKDATKVSKTTSKD